MHANLLLLFEVANQSFEGVATHCWNVLLVMLDLGVKLQRSLAGITLAASAFFALRLML